VRRLLYLMLMYSHGNRFKKLAKGKTTFELNDIILNEKSYMPDLVIAAIAELDRRGEKSENMDLLNTRTQESLKAAQEEIKVKEPFIPKGVPISFILAAGLIYLSVITLLILINYGLTIGSYSYSMTGGKGLYGLILIVLILTGLIVQGGRVAGIYLVSFIILIHIYNFFFSDSSFYAWSLLTIVLVLPHALALVLMLLPKSLKWYKSQNGKLVEEEEFIFRD